MSKKNFTGGLSSLLGEQPKRSKRGRPKTQTKVVTKSSQQVDERKEQVNDKKLQDVRDLNESYPSPELLNQVEIEHAFLKQQTDGKMDAVYYVNFVIRGKNSFGAIIKNNYSATVVNDKNLTVVGVKSMD
jgi:hypothetical protein